MLYPQHQVSAVVSPPPLPPLVPHDPIMDNFSDLDVIDASIVSFASGTFSSFWRPEFKSRSGELGRFSTLPPRKCWYTAYMELKGEGKVRTRDAQWSLFGKWASREDAPILPQTAIVRGSCSALMPKRHGLNQGLASPLVSQARISPPTKPVCAWDDTTSTYPHYTTPTSPHGQRRALPNNQTGERISQHQSLTSHQRANLPLKGINK
uniref:Uncharacterized protein n=1 Tax=Timema monikensis TaxID=170555 RepID=A0A7R9HTX6_9NEOP|nr:unnamed protein product [Timema monikensis]